MAGAASPRTYALAVHVQSLPENLRLFLPNPDGEASYLIV
jgi:hypothetical protein